MLVNWRDGAMCENEEKCFGDVYGVLEDPMEEFCHCRRLKRDEF